VNATTPLGLAALFVVGALAAAINAVAGGGSLLSFPLLVGLGVPPLQANATNSVGIWPGSLGSALGFRNLLPATAHHLRDLVLPTAAGAWFGAWLLVQTSERLFRFAVPGLILAATLLLAFQPQIRAWIFGRRRRVSPVLGAFLQFLVSVYGGYFGAGMGIMMLAVFALFIDGNIHELNAFKAWLGIVINLVASVELLLKGLVLPVPGAALALGAVCGGFVAARLSQRVDSEKLRKAIVVLGAGMVVWFTCQTFS